MADAVTLAGLRRRFGASEILRGVDLSIAAGEFVAMLGRSGAGKTCLLRVLAGLDDGAEGHAAVPKSRAVVFQEPRLLPWQKVWRNVAINLPGNPSQVKAAALDALAEVGLSHRADAWPATLSGGEAQRAGLARALARAPDLLLLDEPFGALDALTRLSMQRLVERLWARHRCAVLLVTHDVDEALLLAHRVVLLAEGRIAREWRLDWSARPRSAALPGFSHLRREILSALGVEGLDGPTETRVPAIAAERVDPGGQRPATTELSGEHDTATAFSFLRKLSKMAPVSRPGERSESI